MANMDVRWFRDVGILRVEDKEIKYYIKSIPTEDYFLYTTDEQDMDYILFFGLDFPKEAGDALFGAVK